MTFLCLLAPPMPSPLPPFPRPDILVVVVSLISEFHFQEKKNAIKRGVIFFPALLKFQQHGKHIKGKLILLLSYPVESVWTGAVYRLKFCP